MEVKIVKKVLDANDTMAEENRKLFRDKNVYVLNIMSSPGSGKTETLVKSLARLEPELKTAVIVGDVCTTNDADRLNVTGTHAVQVNTDEFGGDCHLAAHVIRKAALDLDLDAIDLLIVENIGNLVCPAEFDIGENSRVVLLSVTEGEDKPLKYPVMFKLCSGAAVLNKVDLLPYLDFNIDEAEDNIKSINPDIPVFRISAKTEEGFDDWLSWIKDVVKSK
ncbi:MAG: hydrogenase nickel incorporation protein HypB [Deltaproteobacteria bacterium]|nr:hydrogenase nickel incorporation protein HypB [Deltaproteobacteria bacterium]